MIVWRKNYKSSIRQSNRTTKINLPKIRNDLDNQTSPHHNWHNYICKELIITQSRVLIGDVNEAD